MRHFRKKSLYLPTPKSDIFGSPVWFAFFCSNFNWERKQLVVILVSRKISPSYHLTFLRSYIYICDLFFKPYLPTKCLTLSLKFGGKYKCLAFFRILELTWNCKRQTLPVLIYNLLLYLLWKMRVWIKTEINCDLSSVLKWLFLFM